MLAGRVSAAGAAARADLAGFPSGADLGRRGSAISSTRPPEPTFTPGAHGAARDIKGDITLRACALSAIGSTARRFCTTSTSPCRPGQVVGIVGPSGSGKITLAKLVQRLYVPESGRVLVDGVDLAMVDVAWLRRQIGVVLQENVLFNRSIRDNIALADPGMPIERVIAAAKLAGAHDFILELPRGLRHHRRRARLAASPAANASASPSRAR